MYWFISAVTESILDVGSALLAAFATNAQRFFMEIEYLVNVAFSSVVIAFKSLFLFGKHVATSNLSRTVTTHRNLDNFIGIKRIDIFARCGG